MSSLALPELRGRGGRGRWRGRLFYIFLLVSIAVGFVTLGALVFDVLRKGLGELDGTLLGEAPSQDPAIAGARPASWRRCTSVSWSS